jgi:hypothetical protein
VDVHPASSIKQSWEPNTPQSEGHVRGVTRLAHFISPLTLRSANHVTKSVSQSCVTPSQTLFQSHNKYASGRSLLLVSCFSGGSVPGDLVTSLMRAAYASYQSDIAVVQPERLRRSMCWRPTVTNHQAAMNGYCMTRIVHGSRWACSGLTHPLMLWASATHSFCPSHHACSSQSTLRNNCAWPMKLMVASS